MKKYWITVKITKATGIQAWTVNAESKKEALEKYKNGECKLDSEEFEAHELGEPEAIEIK